MLIVQKYGGTSVADVERVRKVALHVARTFKDGNEVVAVVSAMSGETDRLLKLGGMASAGKGNEGPRSNFASDREMDALVATGEMSSAALTAMAINSLGVPSLSMNAYQSGFVTDNVHQRARIKYIETSLIKKNLSAGNVPVVAGFQGVDDEGDLTTIGRGGSDTSAVALAVALKADRCEIYSDVEGLFSADPNVCPKAVKIERASYEELLETAGAGAKVVHMHAVELAARHGAKLALKRSPSTGCSGKGAGTMVTREEINMDEVLVSTVAHTLSEAKISIERIPNRTGVAARIFEPLAKAGINVDMIVQNLTKDGASNVSFTIAKPDLKRAMQLSEVAAKEIGAGKVEMAGDVAKVSIIGIGMRSHAGVAAKMFETLAAEGIDIQMISTSEIKVSVVVDSKHVIKAVNALHKVFIKK